MRLEKSGAGYSEKNTREMLRKILLQGKAAAGNASNATTGRAERTRAAKNAPNIAEYPRISPTLIELFHVLYPTQGYSQAQKNKGQRKFTKETEYPTTTFQRAKDKGR